MEKTQMLEVISGILFPYRLVTYGERQTSDQFGVQTQDGSMFIGKDLFSFWQEKWHPKDLISEPYSIPTTTEHLPDSDRELMDIYTMALNFQKYLEVSPIIWKSFEMENASTRKTGKFIHNSGTGFFSTVLGKNIETQPDHKIVVLHPRDGEIWTLNGSPVQSFTQVPLIQGQTIVVQTTNPSELEIRTYSFHY